MGGPFWIRVRYKCWKKTYMEARDTTNMKKGWLYRTSYDEKNHEIAPVVLIQIEWGYRSSEDDPAVMIQIQWWSKSSDDVKWWSRSSDDDLDRVMIQIQWWWSISSDDLDTVMMIQIEWWSRSRWRWLEDEDDENSMMIQMIQRRRLVLINYVTISSTLPLN